jgi:uncharacterized membrane protein YjjP (DUF1212 family)/uncharacterized membrane protein YjjB (DUF3815 family)
VTTYVRDGTAPDAAVLRQFLIGIAGAMTASEESVDVITDAVTRIAAAYGAPDTEAMILPTIALIQTGGVIQGRLTLRPGSVGELRFDQIAELYRLIKVAEGGRIDPLDGIARLNEIGAMKPRFGWFIRTIGHALLTTALALILIPTWQGAAIAFGLGLLIGLAKLVRSPTLQLIFPIAVSFVCAVIVFNLAHYFAIGDPLRLLIAPLVTFLPGGTLTTATGELAAGQIVSGATRLISGLVQLALLSFGILAAGEVVGASTLSFAPYHSADVLPWWVGLAGVLLFAIGTYLHFSAPVSSFGWVLVTLLVAYFGQVLGTAFFGSTLSGFVGAFLMTPVVLGIASLKRGAPSQLTFLPAFWLLVPGAAGLIGLTEAVGGNAGLGNFGAALTTVMSIALGVLIGSAAYRTVRMGAHGIQNFTVEFPAETRERSLSLWIRLAPGRRQHRIHRPASHPAPRRGEKPSDDGRDERP